MPVDGAKYDNPLAGRYASEEMLSVFSPERRYGTWRRLWLELARAERELGLKFISNEHIGEMEKNLDDIDFDRVSEIEAETRHDVMAHIRAFAEACGGDVGGVIHLGATSCFVTDNTDVILIRDALDVLIRRLVRVVDSLDRFAVKYSELPTLGFTHFQPAQITTVGKRASLWLQDLADDLSELERLRENLALRGAKGATGTQASYLALFDGDSDKVVELENKLAAAFDFCATVPLTGQTYPRKVDAKVLGGLCGIAQSASKFSIDLRLLAHMREIEEPFGKKQVGSSAMAYKRNPMRAERMTALSRYLMTLAGNAPLTAASQWFERTLDDSANRRLVIPDAFLAADALLILYGSIVPGLVVYPQQIASHIHAELPFMATENILMAAVAAGGDRQELHEKIRVHAQEAAREMKESGVPNDLLDRLDGDPAFAAVKGKWGEILDPAKFTGRAPQQVIEFSTAYIEPVRRKYADVLKSSDDADVKV
ncbi:MAG: adenylosuccinate lyase [Planctomycetota bacterium]|nr:MAG: adenylosuccinate lyase [Planctomycetota bacterium]